MYQRTLAYNTSFLIPYTLVYTRGAEGDTKRRDDEAEEPREKIFSALAYIYIRGAGDHRQFILTNCTRARIYTYIHTHSLGNRFLVVSELSLYLSCSLALVACLRATVSFHPPTRVREYVGVREARENQEGRASE